MIPTYTQLLQFFNLFIGLLLVTSLILFIGGFAMYVVRLGTFPTYREEALVLMKWGVSILFSLVVMLWVQKFLLTHTLFVMTMLAAVVVWLIVWSLLGSEQAGHKHEEKPAKH